MSIMSKEDIRLLTLSKRTLPLTTPLSSILDKYCCESYQGKAFFSFQDYHLIEVAPIVVCAENGDMWQATYNTRMEIRKQHSHSGMRVLQNMVLVGESSNSAFWENGFNTMHFSMIHLSNTSKAEREYFDAAIKRIRAEMRHSKISRSSWVLYYSWDFCDIVLFAKDVKLKDYNTALWNLMTSPDNKFQYFLDTVTIFAFESHFLKKNWKSAVLRSSPGKISSNSRDVYSEESIHEQENYDILLRLSLQARTPLVNLLQTIEHLGIKLEKNSSHHSMGRYDIVMQFCNISHDQTLRLIADVEESLFMKVGIPACGNYEFTFLSRKEEDSTFFSESEVYEEAISQLIQKYDKLFEYTESKISETEAWIESNKDVVSQISGMTEVSSRGRTIYKSIKATVEHGFSEEFGLSVLPAFIAFVELTDCRLRKKLIINGEEIDLLCMQDASYARAFWEFQQRFLTAISTLSHCTMHNDKQFIQVPSFQMRLFEVQPKLLILYSKLAHDIARYLQSSSKEDLSEKTNEACEFLLIPDVRPDVYIDPISQLGIQEFDSSQTEAKIMLVKMWERAFYDPIMASAVLCHEVAHHVGDSGRHREVRTREYFSILAMCMLLNGVDSSLKEKRFGALFTYLSDLISDWIISESFNDTNGFSGPRHHHREMLSAFLLVDNYLINSYLVDEFPAEIAKSFIENLKDLKDKSPSKEEDLYKILKKIASLIEDTLFVAGRKDIENRGHLPAANKKDSSPKCCVLSSLYKDETAREYAMFQTIVFLIDNARRNFCRNLYAFDTKSDVKDDFADSFVCCGMSLGEYRAFCEDVLNAFSEAYADLKMVQMMNMDFSKPNKLNISYHSIMESFGVTAGDSLESMMRRDAIRRILTKKDKPVSAPQFAIMYPDEITNFAERRIHDYLRECQKSSDELASNNPIPGFLKLIMCKDPSETCWGIQVAMAEFRSQICEERDLQ